VHQDFYVVVMQQGGANPKPPQRFSKEAFLHWAAKLKSRHAQMHALYEACGFGFCLQRRLVALGIQCYVVCAQKLDEQNKRVKTDSLDARALCLKLDRFVQGNRAALAIVRVPSEQEEQARAIDRQREQLVQVRKVLEAQGCSLMVNHGMEPVQQWWKRRAFAALAVAQWMRDLLGNTQPVLLALQQKIDQLTLQLQNDATQEPPRGLGKMTSVIIDREIGNWYRFNNRRQIASYTGLCPGEYSSAQKRLQSCVTKHGNPTHGRPCVSVAPDSSSTNLLNIRIPSRTAGGIRNLRKSVPRTTACFVCIKIALYCFHDILRELHRRDSKYRTVELYLGCTAMYSCSDNSASSSQSSLV
jgi:transposase